MPTSACLWLFLNSFSLFGCDQAFAKDVLIYEEIINAALIHDPNTCCLVYLVIHTNESSLHKATVCEQFEHSFVTLLH